MTCCVPKLELEEKGGRLENILESLSMAIIHLCDAHQAFWSWNLKTAFGHAAVQATLQDGSILKIAPPTTSTILCLPQNPEPSAPRLTAGGAVRFWGQPPEAEAQCFLPNATNIPVSCTRPCEIIASGHGAEFQLIDPDRPQSGLRVAFISMNPTIDCIGTDGEIMSPLVLEVSCGPELALTESKEASSPCQRKMHLASPTACFNFHWQVEKWGACEILLPQTGMDISSNLAKSVPARRRNVTCRAENSTAIDDFRCSGPKPIFFEECSVDAPSNHSLDDFEDNHIHAPTCVVNAWQRFSATCSGVVLLIVRITWLRSMRAPVKRDFPMERESSFYHRY